MPTNFYRVNYAKKFDLDISDLAGHMGNLPRDKIQYLLEHNLLSTGMLRMMTPEVRSALAGGDGIFVNEIFGKFYGNSLSINKQEHDRFDVGFPLYVEGSPEVSSPNITIQHTLVNYDPLSPPLFSSELDSMGYFKEGVQTDYPLLDFEYGEAFIELRWFNKIFPPRCDFLNTNFLENILKNILKYLNELNKQEVNS